MNVLRIARQQDVIAGVLLVLIGAGVLGVGRDYPIGTATEMGPGFFPAALASGIVVIGVALAIKGALGAVQTVARIHLRSLGAVVLALVIFALSLERAGLLIATCLLVGIGALGSDEARWREVLWLAIGLAAGAALLFVAGLGLPIRVLP